jgi:hypothetical protein
MKPVMMYFNNRYYIFTDEAKYKEALPFIGPNNPPYMNVTVDEVPAIAGWRLHISGQRGDGTALVDPKNTAGAATPNFDTLEDAMVYLEDSYKAFIGDEGLKAMFEKKAFSKVKGFASFYGNLYPVVK